MGITQKELAQRMHVSEDLIGAIERGVRLPQPDFQQRADAVLEARGLLLASVEDVREALKKARTRHPDWFRRFADAEADSQALHHHEVQAPCPACSRPRPTPGPSSVTAVRCWTRRPSRGVSRTDCPAR